MKEQKRVPKLRFEEFSGEWKEKRLQKLFSEFKSGNGITSSSISDRGAYPVYGGNGLRGYTETFTHKGSYLLIGRQGALCGNINRSNGKSYISEHAIAGMANDENDTEFLAQRLEHYKLNRLSESSAQPGLSVAKLLRFKLIVPLLPEQQKIASFLSSVDKKIAQLQQKKALLEDYKKGVMQQIFPSAGSGQAPQLRFTKEDGSAYPDWEEKRLGEICDINKGTQLNAEFLTEDAKYPCINGGIDASGFTNNFNREKNTITISEGGNSCGFVNFLETKFWCGGHCYSLDDLVEKVNNSFLYQHLKHKQNNIMRMRVGSGLPNIQKKDILKFNIKIPCLEEQTQIAEFLSAIDKKIAVVQTQIEHTQRFKKGLLQQMFV